MGIWNKIKRLWAKKQTKKIQKRLSEVDQRFVLLIFALAYLFIEKSWKPNWWICAGVIIALALLFIGLILISTLYGERKWTFPLNYCSPLEKSDYTIDCTNKEDNKIIAGYNLSCIETPNLINKKGNITFEFHDGKQIIKPYGNFIIPENARWIYFKIHGKNEQNKTLCLSISTLVKIPTSQEYKEDKNRLIKYLLALPGFIAVSIPVILANTKKLLRK